MAGNPLRASSGGEEREGIVRAAQLQAGKPQATERSRAEPVSGGTENQGSAAFPGLAEPAQLLGTETGTGEQGREMCESLKLRKQKPSLKKEP